MNATLKTNTFSNASSRKNFKLKYDNQNKKTIKNLNLLLQNQTKSRSPTTTTI